jgi:hypothetical protein
VKILVVLASPEYLRHYDATLEELAHRGHDIAIAVGAVPAGKPVRLERFSWKSDRIGNVGMVPPRGDKWTWCARAIRGTMDFVRYLHPELAELTALRARVKRQALPRALQPVDWVRALPPRLVRALMRALALLEQAVPPAPNLLAFLDEHNPDLVLVSPLIEPASDQVDIVRAAQGRGVRVATLIASWDNLTNKGDLRIVTDVIVWNEAQKREAVEYHRIPRDRVIVTGAQTFDRWFDRKPSTSRDVFCRMVGLGDGRPFVLFTGSSIFIARADAEMAFVRRWIAALRAAAEPQVRDLAVLVRPHPYNGRAWNPDAFADPPGIAVWPRGGYDPAADANRDGLFNSLFHADAVVGINTSAMIEAAVVGRPVLTVLDEAFASSQEGTLHFHHLLPENGGFLRVARSLDEHVRQLANLLRDRSHTRQELERFVGTFVRPHGVNQPATLLLADAIERLGRNPQPAPVHTPPLARCIRPFLRAVSGWTRWLASPADQKKLDAAGSVPRMPVAVLAVPPVVGTFILLAFAVAETRGAYPFSYTPPANVAEAAGMGLASEVLRYIRAGQDPRNIYDVRPDIISSSITKVTALEAAVWSRRTRLIELLEGEGALDEDSRQHLTCLAEDIGADELVGALAADRRAPCIAGAAAGVIEARSPR